MALSALHPNEIGFQDAFEYDQSFWFVSTTTAVSTAKTLTASQAQSVILPKLINKTLSVSASQNVSHRQQESKTIITIAAQVAFYKRQVTKTLSRSIPEILRISTAENRTFSASQAQVTTRTAIASIRRNTSAQGENVTLRRSATRSLAPVQGESLLINRGIFKGLVPSVISTAIVLPTKLFFKTLFSTQSEIITSTHLVERRFIITALQAESLSLGHSINKIVYVSGVTNVHANKILTVRPLLIAIQSNLVALTKRGTRNFSIVQTQLPLISKQSRSYLITGQEESIANIRLIRKNLSVSNEENLILQRQLNKNLVALEPELLSISKMIEKTLPITQNSSLYKIIETIYAFMFSQNTDTYLNSLTQQVLPINQNTIVSYTYISILTKTVFVSEILNNIVQAAMTRKLTLTQLSNFKLEKTVLDYLNIIQNEIVFLPRNMQTDIIVPVINNSILQKTFLGHLVIPQETVAQLNRTLYETLTTTMGFHVDLLSQLHIIPFLSQGTMPTIVWVVYPYILIDTRSNVLILKLNPNNLLLNIESDPIDIGLLNETPGTTNDVIDYINNFELKEYRAQMTDIQRGQIIDSVAKLIDKSIEDEITLIETGTQMKLPDYEAVLRESTNENKLTISPVANQ